MLADSLYLLVWDSLVSDCVLKKEDCEVFPEFRRKTGIFVWPTVEKPETSGSAVYPGNAARGFTPRPSLVRLVIHHSLPFSAAPVMFELRSLKGRTVVGVYVEMVGEVLGHEIVIYRMPPYSRGSPGDFCGRRGQAWGPDAWVG